MRKEEFWFNNDVLVCQVDKESVFLLSFVCQPDTDQVNEEKGTSVKEMPP